MKYPDTVKLATVTADGYGDNTLQMLDEVQASFVKRSGITRTENIEGETSDAAVYLNHTDPTVLARKDDLEGVFLQLAPYTDNTWYRISSVNIAERKLLNNAIDNVYCRLQKIAGLPYGIRIS